MQAGKLRHRVTFEALTVDDLDSDGAQSETWLPAFRVPLSARIEPLSGREMVAAQAVQSSVSTRMTLRWRDGFEPKMRAIHRGTVYNIEAVIPDPESGRRWVTLLCSSGVNEG